MNPVEMARRLAGPDASEEQVVRMLYRLKRFEYHFWFGKSRPFPSFEEWLEKDA